MSVSCASCGGSFEARSSRAKYCSDRCRKRAQRGGEVVAFGSPAMDGFFEAMARGPVESATAKELETAGRLDTAMGQACLVLARRLDAPGMDTGSAMASVTAALEARMATALRGTAKASAPQLLRDELAARRVRHA